MVDMRASDQLRERTVSRLGAGYSAGLLGFDTLCRRVDRAYGARTVEQLRALVRDLPDPTGWAQGVGRHLRSLTGRAERVEPAQPLLLTPPRAGVGAAFVLGREPECDLLVDDATVSRRHAALRLDEEGWAITDLGSRNGTWINGWRVHDEGRLNRGDAVQLGTTGWVFAPRPV